MLIYAFVKKSEEVKKLSLEAFVLVALATIPTYLSGNATAWLFARKQAAGYPASVDRDSPELRDRDFDPDDFYRNSRLVWFVDNSTAGPRGSGTMGALLVFSLLTAGFILRTASMGGEISHPEIRSSLPFLK